MIQEEQLLHVMSNIRTPVYLGKAEKRTFDRGNGFPSGLCWIDWIGKRYCSTYCSDSFGANLGTLVK